MRLSGLMKPLKESNQFKSILSNIEEKIYPIGVYGLSESAKNYLVNGVYEQLDKSILILTHSDVEAKNIYEDLSFYVNDVYYFPTREMGFYNADAVSGDLRWERLKVMKKITESGKKIIITCIEALAATYMPIDLLRKYIFKLAVGGNLNLNAFSEELIECGYERVERVDTKGQFSIRGGIIDLYPPISALPFRIELYDDEIDSIRTFNSETQRSIDKVSEIDIFPAKEMILTQEIREKGYNKIKEDLINVVGSFNKKKDKEIIKKITSLVDINLESLKETWSFKDVDSYMPYFYDNVSSFLDYMKGSFIVVDDSQRCLGKLDSVYFEFEENYENFLRRGSILPKQAEILIDKQYIYEELENVEVITINAIAKSTTVLKPRDIVSFSQITNYDYHGQLDMLIEDIKDKKSKGYKIVILSGTRTRGEKLIDILRDRGIESVYKDSISQIEFGEVVVTFGNQLKGFEYPQLKLCVISDKEVFGGSKRKATSRSSKKGVSKLKSFTELKLGDYVVHVNHGIGVYKGIKQLEVHGHKRDYLQLSYNGCDNLYVPVEQLDLVQKYIGSEGKAPKISKLGGLEWVKAKNKVKNSIADIAEDLVKLYAARATLKGHRYSKDTVWQKQFEEEFPFEETPDQIIAIEEIKKDMESDKPMDRLICGDVGYGKTEVAVRAAFKAVMDGKQVAFLVPTTILAEQHYKNLTKRFSDFPVKVEMVSRFRTPAEQKVVIKATKEGNVDILIGTHRIIQQDVKFKDLGVLIIDEEQRFGVTHKEKIKSLRKNIDVITLTATPIPRTLHMSLTGVRDISVIETPPEERYPIQTYVVEFNDQLIRDAMLRELNRKGQVFFVYNRVETIKEMAAFIGKLVPEARVCIAHGQMTERELESIMIDFMENKYDILMCTTIIETGIDIQNTNTIIIYDADKMGLSQLYQLRGRVGRSNRIAYAYLAYKKDKVLTEVAEKRLKAIKDFTELGSGFKIAMRDLEIRGAGNMMGGAQHGHMAAVGYDLYCRMLEDTVKKIRGDIEMEPIETSVEIKIDAYIPSTYIEDESQKIEIYKKIAAIDCNEDMVDIQEEIEDRFSDIPSSVVSLMNIAYLRCISSKVGIIEIKEVKEEIILQFDSSERINQKLVKALISKYNRSIVFKLGNKPAFAYKIKNLNKEEVIANLIEIVNHIKSIVEIK
ncbi:transcription-repair coupling factor [Clostridium sp. CM028]|uniref:transcription-repair coupling factor n=1 Tax=unclassified Clostridium TaxID=2614128 RepID=UPI001C0E1B7E|nr:MULTISPECIES: transcription-repair coupling factor [unclassified Clostridium]MBU3093067.1 transcription-repair coupling factor [Clostridium sp. CF011]MBW9148543.1 transcription-repair coupling factor [Clostridium sp. CM028]WAG69122.1 transcription-repair coupling factor [Clostridium sp. CF011]WLC60858.1 transcription-repair coupling factor [Clostridium sp. CM028]